MNFQDIAKTALAEGYDLITVEAMGPKTLVTCERRMSNKEPWVEEIDVPFYKLESVAYSELSSVDGLDVRLTTKGVRAFGRQDNSNIDRIVNNPNGQRQHNGGVATQFQPFSWRREDYNRPVDEPKRPKWHPCY